MAQGKKSFIAYSDWKLVFDELPDEDAGKLIKHIFAYVNDENPQSDSVLIKAVFANIKQTLKRDLVKWESQQDQRIRAGRASAELRKNKLTSVERALNERQRKPTVSVSVSDSVSVNDSVNVSESKITNFTPENLKSFFCQDIKTKAQEDRCKALKVTPAKLIELENEFIEIKTAATEFWPNQKQAVGNFINWALIQLQKKQNGKQQKPRGIHADDGTFIPESDIDFSKLGKSR